MSDNLLFLSRNVKRGGAIYEEEVREVLAKKYCIDTLYLNTSKNKILFFNKFKFSYQVKAFSLKKQYKLLITNKEGVYAGIHKKNISRKILILHHYNENENRYLIARGFLKRKLHAAFKHVDAVVVVADYWKNIISDFVDPEKIYVIRNSFDVPFINNVVSKVDKKEFKKRHGIPEDKTVVYAGNALTIKGYKDVISILDEKKYFIVTSGSKEKDITKNHLHLDLSYEEYLQLLSIADVTVILSKFLEGWNRIAHESLLCGTGVIGTNVGAFGELLNKFSQPIYKQGDNLDEMISWLINDRESQQEGKAYAAKFDINYFSENWNKLASKQLS